MRRAVARITVPTLLLAVLAGAFAASPAAHAELPPGTRPSNARMSMAAAESEGLLVAVNERGRISRSIAGAVSNGAPEDVQVAKPAGATVRKAYLGTATTGFTGYQLSAPIRLNGQDVPITGEIPNGISSYNYFSDVTGLLKETLDGAPAGTVAVSYQEPDPYYVDGSVLQVIWDDPSVTHDQSVTMLYGALKTTGDRYSVHLTSPVHPSDASTKLEMSLGISYSYQQSGTLQYSVVDVNGRRMTTSAGGEDDGRPANGALITVGGEGDSGANVADPYALPSNARSDDELYDLRPFVKDGDTTIDVQTSNPSNDDNIFLATFTMNPPATVSTGDAFVYVALGDSYQSGEGAAVDLRPATNYLSSGYENGENYPESVGGQENTYTDTFTGTGPGNGCHRALMNYAKINRDKLAPGQPVILVDRTCSGAQIVQADKPAIVGPVGGDILRNSQVQTAVDRLSGMGLSAADVDLVTVGMGGNDAKFGDILQACVAPSLLESLLRRYPNAPGEVSWVVQNVGTCATVDQFLVHSDAGLPDLVKKEVFAQQKIKGAFPAARVMQLTYPDILPFGSSPSWCGGLRANDIDYAKQRITDINARIRDAAKTTSTEIVDVQHAFGGNALCPSNDADRLANGINQANFDTEVTRLLNLNGNGDPVARGKLDNLVNAYQDAKSCWGEHLNPFGGDCDTNAAQEHVRQVALDLFDYLNQQQSTIFSNIMSPPGTSDDTPTVGFDRSRGLFHPNQAGFNVDACHVLAQFNGTSGCATFGASDKPPAGGDGTLLEGIFERLLRIIVGHFRPNSTVTLTMYSEPVPLGTVTADAKGLVDTTVRVPDLAPGVHRLVLSGEGDGGVQREQELLVKVPGRPTGSYTTYLTGFATRPVTPMPDNPVETVDVTVNGTALGTFQVDAFGGVLVSVPSVDLLRTGTVTIVATSDTTGKAVTERVDPVPTRPALWATSTADDAIAIKASRFSTNGLVHAEGGVSLGGSRSTLTGGVEYGKALTILGTGNVIQPAGTKITPGQGSPRPATIADYRPKGRLAGGPGYKAIPSTSCVDGKWTPAGPDAISGITYVPCAVNLVAAGRYTGTLAAEGMITVTASGVTIGPGTGQRGAIALVGGAPGTSVNFVGADTTVLGQTVGSGVIRATGARTALACGAVGSSVSVAGADSSATLDTWCLPE